MPHWMSIALHVAASLLLALAMTALIGGALWRRRSVRLAAGLFEEAGAAAAPAFDPGELENLPAPVARYFRFALVPGRPMVRAARLAQHGEFRIGASARPWHTMHAAQLFRTGPPGFLWDAHIQLAPLLAVRVRDGYRRGEASMQARIAGVLPLVDERGKDELNAAALQRYLAEAVWFPTALLPSQGVCWRAIDADRALATLADAGITASLEFRFDAAGAVVEVFAPNRYRAVSGCYLPTAWRGRMSDYCEHAGMRVPTRAEVAWQLEGEWSPYWRARIETVEYEPAR